MGEGHAEVLNRQDAADTDGRKAGFMSLVGILAAIAAASCCVIPFALFFLGVSGAWIGKLTALEPYQPIFTAVAVGSLGYGFVLIYRKPTVDCADGSYCAKPKSRLTAKIGLWTAAVLIIVGLGLPRIASSFFS